MHRSHLVVLVALFVLATGLRAEALPDAFRQRIQFLAQNAGSQEVTWATARLLDTTFFADLVAQWKQHQAALAATAAAGAEAPEWRRTLDIALTWHVDPDERGLSVDVYRVFGPVTVKTASGASVEAHVVEGAVWDPMGNDKRRSFAVEVRNGKVSAIHDAFEVEGANLPPELTETPSVAFFRRIEALEQAAPGAQAKEAIRLLRAPRTGTSSFLDQVCAAWDEFAADAGSDPYAHVWKKLPTSIYWFWVDLHEPQAEDSEAGNVFGVTVRNLRGPLPLKVGGATRVGWIATAAITYEAKWIAAGRKNVTRDFAVLLAGNEIEKLSVDFEEVRQAR